MCEDHSRGALAALPKTTQDLIDRYIQRIHELIEEEEKSLYDQN